MKISLLIRTSLFVSLWFLAGCSFQELPGLVTVPAPEATATAAGVITPTHESKPTTGVPTPAATLPVPDPLRSLPRIVTQYVIDASMDYDAKILDVQQEISYSNTSDVEIPDILLAVLPNRTPGVFNLLELGVDGVPVTNYSLDGQRLRWKLTKALQPGQASLIGIKYQLILPEAEQGDPNIIRPQLFGVTARQVNLTDWYPMIVPFDPAKGWQLANPWLYGEHLVYPLANFDVTLRFTDPATAPVVAASAAAQPVENGTRYILEAGRDFAVAMGRQLRVFTTESGEVAISSYYYPGNESAAQAVLDATVKSLNTYQAFFGPYPHKSLAAVQGDFNDGMEFDGLYYLSNSFYNLYDGTQNGYLVMIAAHEVSHQWWFGQVASDQANYPWLDEALATYCEKLFYEKNYPESVKWWWSYRIEFFQPEGMIDGDVPSYGGFTPYTNATYRQGARFLDELRKIIGDEAFFNFLKDYAAQMDGQIAAPVDFFRILRQHTAADLSELTGKYFSSPPG